jgi:tetratricopeptide (TPR) repeat protein
MPSGNDGDCRSAGRSGAAAARWLPVAVFAGTAVLHVGVWAAIPFRPITIYTVAASLRAAGRLESFRVPDFSPFYFHLHLLLARTGLSYAPLLHAVEILATSLTAALFARLCLEFFPARVAAAGSLLFVLSPAPLLLSHLLLPEVWRVLFDVAALVAFVVYRRTGRLPLAAASGLLLGLSTATRPVALVVAFAIAAALFAVEGRRAWRASLLVAAGPVLFLGLVAVRNRALTGRLDPTVMDPGAVFYGSNNPASRGTVVDSPLLKEMEEFGPNEPDWAHVLYKRFPAVALGRSVSASEASGYWSEKAAAFLRRHPGEALRLAGEKLGLLCRAWEPPDSIPAYELERDLRAARVPLVAFSLLVSLGVVGLWTERRRFADVLPLFVCGVACAASVLLFYVNTRMRAPLVPFAAFFACAALDALRRGVGGRAWRAVGTGALAVLALLALLQVPTDAEATLRHGFFAQYSASLLRAEAANLRNLNSREAAAGTVARAVASAPFSAEEMTLANLPYPPGGPIAASLGAARAEIEAGTATRDRRFDLGILLYEGRDLDAARGVFTALETSGGRFDRGGRCAPAPAFYLARIVELGGGERRDAERLFRSALQTAPGDAATLAHLSVLLEESGRPGEGAAVREELFAERSDVDAAFALGRAWLERGRAPEAAFWLGRVAEWLPDFRRARLYAAAASFYARDVTSAISHAEATFSLREDPAALEAFILPAYEEAARVEPGSAAARFRLGRALRRYGRFAEARERFREALLLDPAFQPARRELSILGR